MKTSESMKNIAPALVAFQSEVQDPRKNSENPYFKSKYVELNDLMAAVKPVANKHGLSIMQDITTELTENGKMKVWCRTRLLHSSGEWVESEGQFNIAKGTDPQSCGSSQTYIRRYDISAFLGIAWEKDDDGDAASQPEQQANKQHQQPADEKQEEERKRVQQIKQTVGQLVTQEQKNQLKRLFEETQQGDAMDMHSRIVNMLTWVKAPSMQQMTQEQWQACMHHLQLKKEKMQNNGQQSLNYNQ